MSDQDSPADQASPEHESPAVEKPDLANPEPTQLTEPLRRISDYQLIRKIGRGGMGEVYEALHQRLKRRVAVKLLPDGRNPDPGILRRFFREMEAAGKLAHPHIVQATDAGEVDGVPYLVMEFVDGADLGHLVRQFGPLPPIAALEAVEQAALGLEHIHHHGLVHRDVKPSNLLMDRQGIVKVGDLGLAQLHQPQGNRALNVGKTSEKSFKRGFIPSTNLSFASDTRFDGSVLLQNRERQPTKYGTDFWSCSVANSTRILCKCYIQDIVLRVLNAPMRAKNIAMLSDF